MSEGAEFRATQVGCRDRNVAMIECPGEAEEAARPPKRSLGPGKGHVGNLKFIINMIKCHLRELQKNQKIKYPF